MSDIKSLCDKYHVELKDSSVLEKISKDPSSFELIIKGFSEHNLPLDKYTTYMYLCTNDELYEMYKDDLPPKSIFYSNIDSISKIDEIKILNVIQLILKDKIDLDALLMLNTILSTIYVSFTTTKEMMEWLDENNNEIATSLFAIAIVDVFNRDDITIFTIVDDLKKSEKLMAKCQI